MSLAAATSAQLRFEALSLSSDRPRALARPITLRTHAAELPLASNLLLAPVANYCDLAWRLVCREASRLSTDETVAVAPGRPASALALACTDLLSPQGLLRGTARSLDLAATTADDSPVCMQLYGSDPDILAEGALWAARHGADVIDINMGCPVDKVTKKDGGSMLLCTPDRTVRTAQHVARTVERATKGRVPVTAKLRLGWDDACIVAPELAVRLARVGIRQITVHGRTTEQRFKGDVRHAGIKDVVDAVRAADLPDGPVPVLGNGDVADPASCITMLARTGCDGVMIGRGSFARPWIFRRCWLTQLALADRPDIDPLDAAAVAALADAAAPEPNEAEKLACIRRYLELMLQHRGEHYAMTHIRRRISWLGKALGPCKPMKERVRLAKTPDDVRRALDEFQAGGLRVRAA